VAGEPGVGKGHVLRAFAERAREEVPGARVLWVECPAGSPYRLWDAAVRAAVGASLEASSEVVRRTLRAFLVGHMPPDEAERTAGHVMELVAFRGDVGPEDAGRIAQGVSALARVAAAVAARGPLLLVVSGADRASTSSLSVATALQEELGTARVMAALAVSPELLDALPGAARLPRSRLGPLGDQDMRALTRRLLTGLGPLPEALVGRLVATAEGVPAALDTAIRFAMEEGCITRREDGTWVLDAARAEALEMPEDRAGLLLARVGKMAARDRETLANAGVVGREVWLGALVALERRDVDPAAPLGEFPEDNLPSTVRASLERLADHGFLRRVPSRIRGEEAWAFATDVRWQVARGLLPRAAAEARHRTVERWLLAHEPNPDREVLAVLAEHAELGARAHRAARYLLRMAQRLPADGRHGTQREVLVRARALAHPTDLVTRGEVLLRLGRALAAAGRADEALGALQEALLLSWKLRQRRWGAQALTEIGRVELDRGELGPAYDHLLRALRLHESLSDAAGVAGACLLLGRMFGLEGNLDDAARSYERAAALYEGLNDRGGLAAAVRAHGVLLYDRGDHARAEERFRRALGLLRGSGDGRGVAEVLRELGALSMARGRPEEAAEAWQEAREMALEAGDRSLEAALSVRLGEAYLSLGRPQDALATLQSAVQLAMRLEQPHLMAEAWLGLARVRTRLGHWATAREALAEVRRRAEEMGLPRLLGMAERCAGELALAQAGGDRPEGGGEPPATDGEARAGEPTAHLELAAAAFLRSGERLTEAGHDLEAAASHDRAAEVLDRLGRVHAAEAARDAADRLRARHPGAKRARE